MPNPAAPARQKAQGSANLTFGLVTVPVDIVGMSRPGMADADGFKQVCPACLTNKDDGGQPVLTRTKQVYRCPADDGHGPFDQGDLAKAREIGGTLYPVSPDQIVYVDEGTIPAGELELHRVPTADLLGATYPAGYVYRLRPKKDAGSTLRMIFGAVMSLAGDNATSLVGQLKTRGVVRWYRFTTWQGQLLITELIRPEALSTQLDDLSDCVPSEQIASQLEVVLPAEAFDPEAWADEKAARFADLDEKLVAGETFVPPAAEEAKPIDPEAAALALLGGGKVEPTAPKKRARKPKPPAAKDAA